MEGARPLAGIRVVDFTSVVAGPWCTRLMADCGAEVIKIEPVGEGDLLRFVPPVHDGASRVYAQFNAGKRSIALDLKAPAGIDVARRLVATADVVIENFRPGVMRQFGLDGATLVAAHPRLVYCSVSGYGRDGPMAGEGAYAPVVQALSGFEHVLARAQDGDGRPLNAGVMIADILGAVYAFGAIQTALLRRERTGEGAVVDVTLMESMVSLLAIQLAEAQARIPPSSSVFRPVATQEGHLMVPLVSLRNCHALFEAIGRAELKSDPRFTSQAAFAGHRADAEAVLETWASGFTAAEARERLRAAGIPAAVYARPEEVLADPHLRQRGAFASLEDAAGAFSVVNPPFRFEGTDCSASSVVAGPGADRAAILESVLGLDATAVRALGDAGAFG